MILPDKSFVIRKEIKEIYRLILFKFREQCLLEISVTLQRVNRNYP